ncbi:hypothetical protein KDK_52060 [Dictyobacter kobayashii]|uniref:Leucine-rich repeat-containing N-terminal plant-type domain-containing protein n=1 Tax=Dictyobacter kobayashii TaxID=2014872 RepID=A0A402AQK8_9CHLR|nr:hypothetical protein KDK_52060 [Dictyobacter kobayashii]
MQNALVTLPDDIARLNILEHLQLYGNPLAEVPPPIQTSLVNCDIHI